MDCEAKLLQELAAGPRRAGDIAMPRSTRKKYARILEDKGLLQRDGAHYWLTPEGYNRCLQEGLVMPSPDPLGDIPDDYDEELSPIIESLKHAGEHIKVAEITASVPLRLKLLLIIGRVLILGELAFAIYLAHYYQLIKL